MSNMKKVAVSASAAALAGLMMIGGASIMAYLTDEEKSTNTFTVGRVNVDLAEPNYPGNNSSSVNDMQPTEEVKKDPQTISTGENSMVSYIQYDIPMAMAITASEVDNASAGIKKGQRENFGGAHPIELFKTVVTNGITEGTGSLYENSTDGTAADGVNDNVISGGEEAERSDAPYGASYSNGKWVDLKGVEYVKVTSEGVQTVYSSLWGTDGLFGRNEPTGLSATSNDIQRNTYNTEMQAAWDAATHEAGYPQDQTKVSKIYARRTYGYNTILPGTSEQDDPNSAESKAARTTKPIFDRVKLANIIEGQVPEGALQDMNIYSYAIQASNIKGITGADSNNTLGQDASGNPAAGSIKGGDLVPGDGDAGRKTTLQSLFNVYVAQQDIDGGATLHEITDANGGPAALEIDSADTASILNQWGKPGTGVSKHSIEVSTYNNESTPKPDQVGYVTDTEAAGKLKFRVSVADNGVAITGDALKALETANTEAEKRLIVWSEDESIATVATEGTLSSDGKYLEYEVTGKRPENTRIRAAYFITDKQGKTSGNKAESYMDVKFYDNTATGKNDAANEYKFDQPQKPNNG